MVESFADVLAKSISSSTGRYAPTTAVIGIRPKEIAHGPFVWYLLYTINSSHVVKGINGRRKATVKTENLQMDKLP
jgi:hypothetical protein